MSRFNDAVQALARRATEAGNLPLEHPPDPTTSRPPPCVLAMWRKLAKPPARAMEFGIFPPTDTTVSEDAPARAGRGPAGGTRERQPGEDDE